MFNLYQILPTDTGGLILIIILSTCIALLIILISSIVIGRDNTIDFNPLICKAILLGIILLITTDILIS